MVPDPASVARCSPGSGVPAMRFTGRFAMSWLRPALALSIGRPRPIGILGSVEPSC